MKRLEAMIKYTGVGAIVSVAGMTTAHDPNALAEACEIVGAAEVPCQIQTEEPQREPRPTRVHASLAISSASASNTILPSSALGSPIFTVKV